MNCYCALHECTLGEKGYIERVDDKKIFVYPKHGTMQPFDVDVKDQRTLIVFDGFGVAGCLPKNSKILMKYIIEHLSVKKENFREHEDYFLEPSYSRFGDTNTIEVVLRRFFILLPSGKTAVMFRYRPKSLSPQGVIIKVENGIARFETTTY
jgi:hypothetical protein